ncbi:MAG: PKD domain-containing protein [Thermoplasmata archaeon]|nr:PKD domain-containing protein [Thermoplasmata archaeon]
MKLKNLWIITMMVSSLFLIATFSVEAETITDGTGDVSSINSEGDTVLITYSPEIEVDNLDLIEATYTLQGTQVTLTLQVNGLIQNQGELIDVNSEDFDMNSTLNYVQYEFNLITSSDDYSILYVNKTCNFTSNVGSHTLPSSDFSANGNTLTVSFPLTSADETYQSLAITSAFTKINLSVLYDPSGEGDIDKAFIWLTDSAPNPPLADVYAEASNVGSVGEIIQFNATVDTTTGQPPYDYHWDFGDQSTSAVLNPTHVYTKAGKYTYNFTVTDNADATASQTGTITITQEGGGDSSLSTQMILFLAILLIVIVIGVVVIVWIIRR